MKKLLFIYNPHAGKGQVRNKAGDIINAFTRSGCLCTAYPTQAPGDAARAARELAAEYDRVAVCGGAGSDYLAQAKALGCAAYITGDVRHHEFLAARQLGLLLMDAGHGATEGIAMPRLRRQLEGAMPGVEVVLFSGEGGF